MSFGDLQAAYEGVDDLARFEPAALAAYRGDLLERSAPIADFLGPRLPGGRVVEVGCGNGRLLIELARRGAITGGLGIDLSRSRIAFARDWAQEAGADIAFEAGDALEAELAAGCFDAALCITGAFGYFGPAGLDAALLATLRAALAPGGLLCLELYQERRRVELARAGGGHVRIWDELAPSDPWRFYLSDVAYDERSAVLTHAKTFIHREGEVDSGRVERLRVYEPDAISGLLEDAGFGGIETFDGWSGAPYEGGELLVVTSRTA